MMQEVAGEDHVTGLRLHEHGAMPRRVTGDRQGMHARHDLDRSLRRQRDLVVGQRSKERLELGDGAPRRHPS